MGKNQTTIDPLKAEKERFKQEKQAYKERKKQIKREQKEARGAKKASAPDAANESDSGRENVPPEKQAKRTARGAERQYRREWKENRKAVIRGDEIRWDKLDNTAHLFPVIAGEGLSNVYRVSVILKEEVDRELLQRALDMVLPKFFVFNCRLRKGLFWYYFEENGKRAPRVIEECSYPCQYIVDTRNRNYLFRVTYYHERINLEAFHALTDGNGALNFLKELTYQYLRLAHRELSERFLDQLSSSTSLNTEDSFLQNFKKSHFANSYKSERAYLLKGAQFPKSKMGIMHGRMPLDAVKSVAKQYGATINEFLVAVFIWAIYREYLKGMPSKAPVTVSVPVNLRPYYQSVTTKNFFVMVTATFHPKGEDQPFEDILDEVMSSLREQITKEHLEEVFSHNVTGERAIILRTIPLVFKNIGLRSIYNMTARANTATVTNLGNITVEQGYEDYIENFSVLLSRSKGQCTKMSLCTYRGVLTATITSTIKDTRLQRAFYRSLAERKIPVELETNGVYYE